MTEEDRILSYSPPPPSRSQVPVFGVVACVVGVLCGIAVVGFGIWWFITAGTDGIFRGFAIIFTGALIVFLCGSWYRKARLAMQRVG